MEGTTAEICVRCSWASSSHPTGSNQRMSTASPCCTACSPTTVTSSPYAWESGRASRPRTTPGMWPASWPALPANQRFSWESSTPLDRPVVPPV